MSFIVVALLFNGIDILSGFLAALKKKDVQSSKLRDGLFKKVGFIFCYLVAYIMDNYAGNLGLSINVEFIPILCSYAVVTELTSIIENIHKLNSDILPEKLLNIFKLTDKGDENVD